MVSQGFKLKFLSLPAPSIFPSNFTVPPHRLTDYGSLSCYSLLGPSGSLGPSEKNVIAPVPLFEWFQGFLFQPVHFARTKRDNRPSLDPNVGDRIHYICHCLPSSGRCFDFCEYQSAYLHVLLFPAHMFPVGPLHYTITALPFSLPLVPQVFTKLLTLFHTRGIFFVGCSDYCWASSRWGLWWTTYLQLYKCYSGWGGTWVFRNNFWNLFITWKYLGLILTWLRG